MFISNIYSHNYHKFFKDKLDSVVFQHEMDFFSCIDSNETTSSVTNEHWLVRLSSVYMNCPYVPVLFVFFFI